MATVTGIEHRYSNCGLWPYAAARLDCGHRAEVQLTPSRGTCWRCKDGVEVELGKPGTTTFCAKCGGSAFVVTFSPKPHCTADQVTKVGDAVACTDCVKDQEQLEWLRNLDVSLVHHSRYKDRFGGMYYFYRRDVTSPSGFMLIGGVSRTPAVDALLDERRLSPLSPTEPA